MSAPQMPQARAGRSTVGWGVLILGVRLVGVRSWGAFSALVISGAVSGAVHMSHCGICDGRTAVLVGEGLDLGFAELRPEYTSELEIETTFIS